MSRSRPPVILCILDGYGLGAGGEDDAIATARTPVFDSLRSAYPFTTLKAHGIAVGLPSDADMGNSEVGHNAMGAGRIFDQGAKLVDAALHDGRAFQTEVWKKLTQAPTLHLLGLFSDGNVHSHVDHVYLLLDQAARDGVQRLRLHLLTDGRDVEARSALTWIRPLEARLQAEREAGRDWRIASGGGRMNLTMDRYEADWSMVERGWQVHVEGRGEAFPSASVAIQTLYDRDARLDDQTLPGFVITEHGEPVGPIQDGDSVLFFNFRGDRAIEISRAFTEPALSTFPHTPRDVFYAGMMQYDGDLKLPEHYLVSPPNITEVVGTQLARAQKHSFVTSETQKFGHVTFFFNGNRSGLIDPDLEVYTEIPSDLAPFETRPWMKAAEITDAVLEALDSERFDHLRLNLPNGDMVGHTGDLEATRVAIEAVDLQLRRLVDAAERAGAILLVTADHGNADEMYQHKKGKIKRDAAGEPLIKPSHTLNLVPFILVDPTHQWTLAELSDRGLGNIGATILQLCGVDIPSFYNPSLVTPA